MRDYVGTWQKQSGDAAASHYPLMLTLLPNGQYRGEAAIPGEFTFWDVGSWSEAAPGVLELSTANDAHIRYKVSRDGDELEFVTPDDERIRYRFVGD